MARTPRLITVAGVAVATFSVALPTLQAQALSKPARLIIAQTASLDVVINEIAWMGTTASCNDEWIELYNNTTSPVDLTDWSLSAADGTPSISLSGIILARGYFLLERTDDDSVPGVTKDLLFTGALENEGEDLILRDGASTVVDRVDCGAGWFAGHDDARVPMVRVDTLADGS